MRPLSTSACLEIWERGSRLHPMDRGLLALSHALPDAPPDSIADWPLGRRNAALLDFYCGFTSDLQAWTACERCGERMEMELDAREFLHEHHASAATAIVSVGQHSFRLPSSRDLAFIAQEAHSETAAQHLIERCRINGDGTCLSPAEFDEVEEALAAADPLSEIRLSLDCPACGRTWIESLDIAEFLWAEIEVRAHRFLWEVHALASAYGWTEATVLSLSERRRSLYLEMVSSASPATTEPARRGTLHAFPGIAR